MEIRHGTVRQVRTGPGPRGPLIIQVLHEAILPLDLVEGIGLSNVLNPPQEHVGIAPPPVQVRQYSYSISDYCTSYGTSRRYEYNQVDPSEAWDGGSGPRVM